MEMEIVPENKKQESQINNLLFNLVIPIFALNFLSKKIPVHGPLIGLLIAVAFPIAYGIMEYRRVRKLNFMSGLGFVSVLLSGGFALFKVEGIWFAVKDGAIPLILGLSVFASVFTKNPMIKMLIMNKELMNVGLIEEHLKVNGTESFFDKHLRKSTLFLGLTFILSAVLNYFLALMIFTKIDPSLPEHERAIILNEQISSMTWRSYIVIVIPCLICMLFVLWYVMKGIKKYTGLNSDQIMVKK